MKFDRRSYFITVAQTRNISKAAQLLHVSQPSLSQYITRLEEEIGFKLLDRSTNPISLTDAGEFYLEYVQDIMAAGKKLEERLSILNSQYSDTLTVGVPGQMVNMLFKTYIMDFMNTYPNINVVVKEGTSITLRESLINGEVDVAILHNLDKEDSRFVRKVLYTEELELSCNAGCSFLEGIQSDKKHPIKINSEIKSELEKMRLMAPPGNYLHSVALDRFCKDIGLRNRKIQRVPDIRTIADFIAMPGSDAISIIPSHLYVDFDKWDGLAYLVPEDKSFYWYLCIDRLSDINPSEVGKLFWDMVVNKPLTAFDQLV